MTTMLAVPTVHRLRYEPGPGRRAPAAAGRRVVAAPPPFVLPEPDEAPVRRSVVGILQCAIEVLDGRRTPEQLEAQMASDVLGYWRAEAARKGAGTASRMLRMRLFLPHADAAEVAAVCRVDGRVRALAARFERQGSTWCCTVLRLA